MFYDGNCMLDMQYDVMMVGWREQRNTRASVKDYYIMIIIV